ncbi:hypothetical protein [Amycolatopsis saalfeldensis]|uniref:Uncharacterized protein n=1 Tax=Amycolatopsis saalfeldensis TaxID=394193 RepID=A0A1H8YMY0_9PSEU|nr:hypothetical protein [Amycolatopsis saalfeldensis]SEP53519.1 hypothetical protein SAMN04489732_1286 [Amycolatopsis saalfeldensis]
MDLTAWLLRHTPVRPLVVTTIGGTAARLAVEREIRQRGWRCARNPAEANLLVVAGPETDAMAPFSNAVWQLVPVPRVRVEISGDAGVAAALTAAERQLRSVERQRVSAAPPTEHHEPEPEAESAHTDHAIHDHGAREHGPPPQHEMPREGHGDHTESHDQHTHHGGHDMSGHDMGGMSMPGGIPMADRADDRDGLKLDRLTVPLGPILPDWPAGLIVRVTLHGDVIQDAEVETVQEHGHGPDLVRFWDTVSPDRTRVTAQRLDSCARLLSVAGWEYAATLAYRLRDEALAGRDNARELSKWARRIRRSRTLRWSLSGLGSDRRETGRGDAADRLYRWLDEALGETPAEPDDPNAVLEALPALLAGTELAAARLIIASLDPDLERMQAAHG